MKNSLSAAINPPTSGFHNPTCECDREIVISIIQDA